MTEQDRYCTFMLDGLLFGVEVERVQEVLIAPRMTKVPLAPAIVGGLVNQRGQIVTALELRRRLDMKERAPEEQPMIIMVRTETGVVAWLVDEIGDVIETSPADFESTPQTLQGVGRELIRGTFKLENHLLLALDVEKVMSSPEEGRKGLVATHADV